MTLKWGSLLFKFWSCTNTTFILTAKVITVTICATWLTQMLLFIPNKTNSVFFVEILYSGKVCERKILRTLKFFGCSQLFSLQNLGVWHPLAVPACNSRKFSLQNSFFFFACVCDQKFCPMKVSRYTVQCKVYVIPVVNVFSFCTPHRW